MAPDLQVISEGKEEEVDRNVWKIVVLAILTIAASAFSVFFFEQFLLEIRLSSFLSFALLASTFLVFTLLLVFFVKGGPKLFFIVAAATLLPLVFFLPALYPQPSLVLIAGAVVWFLCSIYAVRRGQQFLKNGLKIRFFETTRFVLPRAFTGFLIFLSVLFYLNYFAWGHYRPEIGRNIVYDTLQSSESLAQVWVANISFEKSLQYGLNAFAEVELRKQHTASEITYTQLSPPEQARALTAATGELKTYLEKFTGPLDLQTPLNAVIYNLVERYVSDFASKTAPWFGIIVTLIVFFVCRGVIAILSPIVRFIAFLVYKFLVAVGFAYVALESRRREFILLS